ncbi:MAG: hypothetical protein AAGG80_03405 [Pseudomonadota bacterium]
MLNLQNVIHKLESYKYNNLDYDANIAHPHVTKKQFTYLNNIIRELVACDRKRELKSLEFVIEDIDESLKYNFFEDDPKFMSFLNEVETDLASMISSKLKVNKSG